MKNEKYQDLVNVLTETSKSLSRLTSFFCHLDEADFSQLNQVLHCVEFHRHINIQELPVVFRKHLASMLEWDSNSIKLRGRSVEIYQRTGSFDEVLIEDFVIGSVESGNIDVFYFSTDDVDKNWDWIEKNLPDYYSSREILEIDILTRYLENEEVSDTDLVWIEQEFFNKRPFVQQYLDDLKIQVLKNTVKAKKNYKEKPKCKYCNDRLPYFGVKVTLYCPVCGKHLVE